MRHLVSVFVSLALLGALTACAAETPNAANPVTYTAVPRRDDDRIAIHSESNRVTFDITSPSGISGAVFTAQGGWFPDDVRLRLFLSGLEELTVSYGDIVVQAAVSSLPPYETRQSVQIGATPVQPIDPDSAYWMEIMIVSAESSSIPLHDGHFDVRLPADFADGAYTAFTADWIDFYR